MKAKSKAPPRNLLSYWWNEFLFARSFVYTTTLSAEDCEKALQEIAHPVDGCFSSESKTVDIQREDLNESAIARFDIRLKRRRRSSDVTSVKAEGTIAYDKDSSETIVQGRTKFGAAFYYSTTQITKDRAGLI